jgi:hypothetical protein
MPPSEPRKITALTTKTANSCFPAAAITAFIATTTTNTAPSERRASGRHGPVQIPLQLRNPEGSTPSWQGLATGRKRALHAGAVTHPLKRRQRVPKLRD